MWILELQVYFDEGVVVGMLALCFCTGLFNTIPNTGYKVLFLAKHKVILGDYPLTPSMAFATLDT